MADPVSTAVVMGVVSAVGGSIAFARRFAERRRVHRIVRAQQALAERALEGDGVRFTGVVRAVGAPLTAPLSTRPCVLYRSRVFVGAHWNARDPSTQGPHESFEARPFVVDGGDLGEVIVDSEHVLLAIEPLAIPKHTRARRQFLLVHGLRRFAWARFEEMIVAPGDTITVGGTLVLDPGTPGAESGFREDAPPRRRLSGSAERPLVILRV